jgi:uncharacterized protein YbcC (UPF0753/DUF2309 family)
VIRDLATFIDGRRAGIDSVIETHAVVRDLVSNEWLHLLRIEPTTGAVERWIDGGWAADGHAA